jgi:hypothetical protein
MFVLAMVTKVYVLKRKYDQRKLIVCSCEVQELEGY